MNPSLRSIALLLAACALEACASTPSPAPGSAGSARRRRRRRAVAPVAPAAPAAAPAEPATVAAPAVAEPAGPPDGLAIVPTVRRVGAGSVERPSNAPSMGSPVVQPAAVEVHGLTPRWAGPRSAPRIVCEGDGNPQRASMQSPYDPTSAMIVRAFLPVERQVIACAPPVDREGRVPVRVLFSGNGLPLEVSLSAGVTRAQGLCLGAALCGVRLGPFRAPNATVNYGFVAAVAAGETTPPAE